MTAFRPAPVLLVCERRIVVEALEPALRSVPEIELAGIIMTLDLVPAVVRRFEAPILLLDFGDRLLPGWETSVKIMNDSPATRTVALLPSLRRHGAALLSRSHFTCLVHQSARVRDVVRAVRRVAAGRCPNLRGISWCMSGFRQLGGRLQTAAPAARLSSREMEVLHSLIQGRTSREIGGRLFISPRTVENHVAALFRKLALHDKRALSCPDVELDDSEGVVAAPTRGCPLRGKCLRPQAATVLAHSPSGPAPRVRSRG